MFRYLALTWNGRNPEATTTAQFIRQRLLGLRQEWHCIANTEELIVFHADARPNSSEAYLLRDGGGVVLGKLFERTSGDSSTHAQIPLSANESAAILNSAGRRLIEHYWGRYVAFLRNPETRTVSILRDPTGALPCFVTRFQGVSLCFSCAADYAALGLVPFSLNWTYIAAFVCCPTLEIHETGLNEIFEVQAGECWQADDTSLGKRTLYWNPAYIARSNPIDDFDAAVEALRRTTKLCVQAWASSYKGIIHLLSGGLDSAIVLSCLQMTSLRPAITCLNYFDPLAQAGDERAYARLAANAAGCELIESEDKVSEVMLETILEVPRSAKPLLSQYYVRHSHFEGQLAERKAASAIFQGAGGDQVFYQSPIMCTAVDHAYYHGIGSDFFRMALKVARMEKVSILLVLREAILRGVLSPRWNPTAELGRYLMLVPSAVIDTFRGNDYTLHPWLKAAVGVPQGKLQHILMMSVSHDFYDPLGLPSHPERVRPLVSQPLIELCLRIPTYILAAGGLDRAVARRAFRHSVPQQIIERRSKGTIDESLHQLLKCNLRFIRETLLDGLLVKQKLLDGRKLEEVLSGQRASFGPEVGEILCYHLATEAWARRWADA